MNQRLGQYPRTWYCVSYARDLEPGKPVAVRFFGKDLMLFRAPDGSPRLVSRFCPHRGADMMLGNIKGDGVECLLHKRCYNAKPGEGPNRGLERFLCVERNLSIYAWYSPDGAAPQWEPEAVFDTSRYHHWLGTVGDVSATVRDFSEGVLDDEHFPCIHGEEVEQSSVRPDGHKMIGEYTMRIEHGTLLRGMRYSVRLTGTGPGLTFGEARVLAPFMRNMPPVWINVCQTPVDEHKTRAWGHVATPRQMLTGWVARVPLLGWALNLLYSHLNRWFTHWRFQKTYQEDVTFFKDRVWIPPEEFFATDDVDDALKAHVEWYRQFEYDVPAKEAPDRTNGRAVRRLGAV